MKKFQWKRTVPETVRLARKKLVEAAGGVSHIARSLGISRPAVDRILRGDNRNQTGAFMDTLDPRLARELVKMADHKVTLKEVAPDQFKGLTVKELGYTPKPE